MYNKIQPEQIEIHAFSSPSGHISFTKGSNYVYANLNNSISGDFNVTGSFKVNNQSFYTTDPSNSYTSTNNVILGGKINNISQATGCAIINSISGNVKGKNNLDLNSNYSSFDSSSSFCTVLAGKNNVIQSNVIGSTVIYDHSSSSSITESNKLFISFANGVDIQADTLINGNLTIDELNTGTFKSDCYFTKNVFKSGLSVATEYYTNLKISGDNYDTGSVLSVNNQDRFLNSKDNVPVLYWTGSSVRFTSNPNIDGKIFLLNGDVIPNMVNDSGNQNISGLKTFDQVPTVNGVKLQTGSIYQNIFLTANTTINTTSTSLISSEALPDSGIYSISSNINLRKNSASTGYCDLFLSTGSVQIYSQRMIALAGLVMHSQNFSTIVTGYVGTQFNLSGIAGTASMFTGMHLNGATPSSNLCITKIADIY